MRKILDVLETLLSGLFKLPSSLLPTNSSSALEPIEIRRAIAREIAGQVQSRGGGGYFFPYREVVIEILARDDAEKQFFQASFGEADMAAEVRARISESGCRPDEVTVLVAVKEEPASAPPSLPYRIRYQWKPSVARTVQPRPAARLVVLQGQAETPEVNIDRDVIYIGRMKQVMNTSGGIERRNELAFSASETSVSRKQAWIRYDPGEGKFRAFHDPTSSQGTRILRDGTPMPCDSTRGVQLRSGDELVLGQVRVRFDILS